MARDHARIHLDIWGDDDWLDLPADAQALYLTLYTSPGRTLCGAHEWNVGKIAQRASDWTVDRIEAAAEILSQRLFLIIDTDTSECLLRSWIKHDGLWRTPNMAVSVANARAEVASRTLRGVIVFEVAKLKKSEPESTSWARDQVRNMLSQKAIDPATLETFKGASNPGAKGGVNPSDNPGSNPSGIVNGGVGVKGGSNGGPTIATSIAIATNRDDDDSDEPPPYVVDAAPEFIDNAARPTKAHPSSAAKTVVRQELGSAGYPHAAINRLAVQVGKLAREGHPDALIREALREWDHRDNCDRPEFLPTVLSDVVKRSRSSPAVNGHDAKVNDYLAFANQPTQRELEQ